jgi:hypothetical protein
MADVKISGLPASTTPLDGTEVLPVVQGTTTKQVSVTNLTAGRATSALSYLATKVVTSASNQGAYAYGTLGYSDINIYGSYTSSVNAYAQKILQNTNNGANASVDFVISNDLGTASTYYGDFGVTSSGYNTPGQNIINTANTVYLQSVTMPLAIGTLNSNALSFYTNSVLVGAFNAAGAFSLNTALGVASGGTGLATVTAGQVLYGNGTSALSSSGNMTFDGTKLTLANDASIAGMTVGKGNSSIATNTATGYQVFNVVSSGSNNSGYGYQTLLRLTTGSNNTGSGTYALASNLVGNNNTAHGYNALGSLTASNSVGIGTNAGQAATGGNNTFVGASAGATGTNNVTTGTNNILLGYNAQASAPTVSGEMTLGGSGIQYIRYPHSYGIVSALPSASTVGRGSRTFVTDALTPVFQATVTGGGAVFTPVYSDGTNWKVG